MSERVDVKEVARSVLTEKNLLILYRKYIRYNEGAKRYGVSQKKFERLAKEAGAVYKIDQVVLVNTEIVEEYLENFKESTEDDILWQK